MLYESILGSVVPGAAAAALPWDLGQNAESWSILCESEFADDANARSFIPLHS